MFIVVVMSTCFHAKRNYLVILIIFSASVFQTVVKGSLKELSPSPVITEADVGTHLVLLCNVSDRPDSKVFWMKDGHPLTPNLSWELQENQGALVSQGVTPTDAGNYTCRTKSDFRLKELRMRLFIKTPPSKLVNVTVHASSVVAIVCWHVSNDGGYPITHFTLIHRPMCANCTEDQKTSQSVNISSSYRQYFLYHLKPGTDYMFRLWGNNKLGPGVATTIQASTSKTMDPPGSLKELSPTPVITEVDVGTHLVLFCNISDRPDSKVFWMKDGHPLTPNLSWELQENQGALVSQGVTPTDAGNYTCRTKSDFRFKELRMRLFIKTPPSKLVNVTVHPSSVVATVRWHVSNDGGYPITHFTLIHRPMCANYTEDWQTSQSVNNISSSFRQYFLYQLKPGTDYMFRLWANNKLGPGEVTTIQASTSKPMDPPEILQHMMANSEDFSSAAWMVAISMVMGTVLVLSCVSCILIYKEGKHDTPKDNGEGIPRIITNPGFDIDIEERYLLDHADYNDNIERPIRTNNNTVVQPSRV